MAEFQSFRDPLTHDTIASARISDKEILAQMGRNADSIVYAACHEIAAEVARAILKEMEPRVMKVIQEVVRGMYAKKED